MPGGCAAILERFRAYQLRRSSRSFHTASSGTAFNGWQVTPVFDKIGEQWVEGVLFHLALAVPLLVVWKLRELRRS